jgi:hypothetical protein
LASSSTSWQHKSRHYPGSTRRAGSLLDRSNKGRFRPSVVEAPGSPFHILAFCAPIAGLVSALSAFRDSL